MSKMTLEQVRDKLRSRGEFYRVDPFEERAMADAYAERIKADEGANDRIDFKGMWNAMSDRAYAHPPAQAAQVEEWKSRALLAEELCRAYAAMINTIAEPPAQPTKLEDAVREVVDELLSQPFIDRSHEWRAELADKLTAAMQESAK